jgi:hypothetical protein
VALVDLLGQTRPPMALSAMLGAGLATQRFRLILGRPMGDRHRRRLALFEELRELFDFASSRCTVAPSSVHASLQDQAIGAGLHPYSELSPKTTLAAVLVSRTSCVRNQRGSALNNTILSAAHLICQGSLLQNIATALLPTFSEGP